MVRAFGVCGSTRYTLHATRRYIMVYAIKKPKETTPALLRRFTKHVQQSGILREARKSRFYNKKKNKHARKSQALRRIERQKERERLWKLGRLKETTKGAAFRPPVFIRPHA